MPRRRFGFIMRIQRTPKKLHNLKLLSRRQLGYRLFKRWHLSSFSQQSYQVRVVTRSLSRLEVVRAAFGSHHSSDFASRSGFAGGYPTFTGLKYYSKKSVVVGLLAHMRERCTTQGYCARSQTPRHLFCQLVMSRLPDSDRRTVRLYLINIPPFNPNRQALHNGLRNHNRLGDHSGLLNHDRLGHDSRRGLNHDRLGVIRTRQRRPDYAANHPSGEFWPEVTSSRPPVTAAVMVVAMPTVVITSMPPYVMMPPMCERSGRDCRDGDCQYEFLDLICPFLFRLKLVCRHTDQSSEGSAVPQSSWSSMDIPAAEQARLCAFLFSCRVGSRKIDFTVNPP